MVKKTKEAELNLYNFNAHDEEIEKKPKKNNRKKKAPKKNSNVKNKNEDNKFSFDNEIIIGLPKVEQKEASKKKKKPVKKQKNVKKKNTGKKQKSKISKNKKKAQKAISPKQQELKNKKKKRNLKIAKYSFLIICIIAIIIATMTSPLFNIKEITVEGNEKTTNDEIVGLSEISIGENTYKTNMKKAKEKILENSYINSVEIKRKLPSKVLITVEERKTTFMIEYGSAYVYINNQGYILEISSEKLEVPIIQGAETLTEDFIEGKRLCIEDLEKMSTVIKIMEVAANNEISDFITRIDIQNSQNYKIVFESEQKVAYLGDESDLNTKILNIKAILEKESGIKGEIFVNMDLKTNNPIFRQSV